MSTTLTSLAIIIAAVVINYIILVVTVTSPFVARLKQYDARLLKVEQVLGDLPTIKSLDERVTNTAKDLKQLTSTVASNYGMISESIKQLDDKISSISSGGGGGGGGGVPDQVVDKVDKLEKVVNSNVDKLTALTSNVSSLSTNVSQAVSNVDKLTTSVTKIQGDVSSLINQTTMLVDRVSKLENSDSTTPGSGFVVNDIRRIQARHEIELDYLDQLRLLVFANFKAFFGEQVGTIDDTLQLIQNGTPVSAGYGLYMLMNVAWTGTGTANQVAGETEKCYYAGISSSGLMVLIPKLRNRTNFRTSVQTAGSKNNTLTIFVDICPSKTDLYGLARLVFVRPFDRPDEFDRTLEHVKIVPGLQQLTIFDLSAQSQPWTRALQEQHAQQATTSSLGVIVKPGDYYRSGEDPICFYYSDVVRDPRMVKLRAFEVLQTPPPSGNRDGGGLYEIIAYTNLELSDYDFSTPTR